MSEYERATIHGYGDAARDFDEIAGWKGKPGARPPARRPLMQTWSQPRETFREMMKARPTHLVLPLAVAWGVSQAISRVIFRGLGDQLPISTLLALTVAFGAIGGVVMVWVFGWVWSRAGRLLGGRGDARALRAAIAWGQAPALWLLALEAIQFAVIGPELFRAKRPGLEMNADIRLFYTVTLWFRALFLGSILGRIIILIAEAHRFSIGRALGTILLGLLATLGPFVALAVWLVRAN